MTTLTKEMFEVELKALLKKYKAEMSVREGWCGYAATVEGIDVDFDGIYTEEGDIVRGFTTLELPTTMTGE
jgi:hypothetical protein